MSPAEIFTQAFSSGQEYPPLEFAKDRDLNALWQLRHHIIDRAREAAIQRGRSYRSFCVGAAAFLTTTKPDLLRSMGKAVHTIYTGANLKMGRDERNTCAEQEIVAQIRQQEHIFPVRKILALVVAGEPQDEPDGESGIFTHTLHPCRHCRKLLSTTQEIQSDSIIITVRIETDTPMEAMLFRELLELHTVNKNTPVT